MTLPRPTWLIIIHGTGAQQKRHNNGTTSPVYQKKERSCTATHRIYAQMALDPNQPFMHIFNVVLLSLKTKMAKRSYTIAFKWEVIAFMDRTGETAYSACKYFSDRDGFEYDISIFYQWYKKRDDLMSLGATNKRALGAGRKPNMEDLLADEIINLRLQKNRGFTCFHCRQPCCHEINRLFLDADYSSCCSLGWWM